MKLYVLGNSDEYDRLNFSEKVPKIVTTCYSLGNDNDNDIIKIIFKQ